MQRLVWQNANGDEINLTSGNYGITEWEGFSNASLNIQSQQVPSQDGGVFLDALIEQRELSVTLKMQDNGNLEERYRMRRELIHALNPKLGEGYLIYTNDFTSKRIKCVAQIPLFETHNSDMAGTPKASLSWTACEPYWEDLEDIQIPLKKGNNTMVINEGDVETEIKIEAIEQGVNLYVQNQTTEKKIEIIKNIDGVVEINTNRGQKSVIESNFGSEIKEIGILNCLINKNGEKLIALGQVVCSIDNYDKLNVESMGFSANKAKILNNKYFAINSSNIVSPSDKIHYSSNGKTWDVIDGTDIAFGNNRYFVPKEIFIGEGGALYDENMQFISEITISGSQNEYGKTIFANNIFLTMQQVASRNVEQENYSYDVAVSSDAENWTRENPITNVRFEYLIDIVYFENKIVAVDHIGYLLSTSQGDTWEITYIDVIINDVNVIDNKLYLFTNDGLYAGTTLSNIEKITDKKLLSLVTRNNIFYGVDNNYNVVKSEDLSVWVIVKSCYYTNSIISGVKTDKALFFTTGNNKIIKKIDNIVTELNLPSGGRLYDITECNNELIAGASNYILRSVDYSNFEKIITDVTDLKKVIYGEGKYIGIRSFGSNLYRSNNLTSWSQIDLSIYLSNEKINDCIYDKYRHIFIAVSNSKVITSADGISWSVKRSGYNSYFSSISVSRNQIIISGKSYYLSSYDGETFNLVSVEYNKSYTKSVYGNGTFLIIGNGFLRIIKEGQYKTSYPVNTNVNDDVVLSYFDEKENCFVLYNRSLTIFNLVFTESQNIISNLSSTSDMSLSLKQGSNEIFIYNDSGDFNATISYRQKYIGV